jgi:hypothetical protein
VKGEELPMMALAVGMQSSELRGVRAARPALASGVGVVVGGTDGVQSGGSAYSQEK